MSAGRGKRGFVQREFLLLVAAATAAIPVFVLTRAAASWNRHLQASYAEFWYHRGVEQQRQGDLTSAAESYRSAVVNERGNRLYGLALAAALSSQGRTPDARQTLLRLREEAPEDSGINLELARLAARESHPGEALRYYHVALDGLWNGQTMQRIEVRVELAEFLLRHHQRDQALSELLALTFDLPPSPPAQVRAGRLFLEAGDAGRARECFLRALKANRRDPDARAGLDQCTQILAGRS